MREWLYVYANPEGLQLLEKVEFIMENADWEQLGEDRRNRFGQSMIQLDYRPTGKSENDFDAFTNQAFPHNPCSTQFHCPPSSFNEV